MSRLVTCGFELGSAAFDVEGQNQVILGTPTIVSAASSPTRVRSGDFACRVNGTGAAGHEWGGTSGLGVEDRTYFARAAFNIAAYGAGYTHFSLLGYQIGPSPFTTVASVRLRPDGTLQLAYNTGAGPVFIGPAVAVNLDQHYVVELECRISAAGNDTVGWKLDGVLQHEDTALAIGTTMGDVLNVGFFDIVGSASTAVDIYYDDVAMNDDQGASQNTWVGVGRIFMLRPTSDNARVGWTDNAGATTNLFDAVDNAPPIGEPPAVPTFVGAGAAVFTVNNVANPTALTPVKHASTANGNVMFLVTESRSITATVGTPTGWTLVSGFPKTSGTASGGKIYLFTRTADGTANDAPTVTWTGLTTGTTGDSAGARILSYSGVTATVDAAAVVTDVAATTPGTLPDITTVTNNALVLGIGVKQSDTAQTATVATRTERTDDHTTSGTGHLTVTADEVQTPAGAAGTAAITPSSTTSSRWLLVTVAFTPATATAKAQIKDANSNTTDTYDANLESYDTAGVPAGTIDVLQAIVSVANSTATQRSVAVSLLSNPVIADGTGSSPAGIVGSWPNNWNSARGTISYAPSVTRATSPVLRVRKNAASADTMFVSFAGLYVDVSPVAGTTFTKAGTIQAGATTLGFSATSKEVASAGTIAPKASMSGADVLETAETGQVSPKALLSGADVFEASETGQVSPKAFASAADVENYARQALFGPKAFQSGADSFQVAETGTISPKALESGADVYEAAETGTISSKPVESGSGAAGAYNKTGTIGPKAAVSGADAAQFSRTGQTSPKASESGTDAFETQETGTVQTGARLSGSKTAAYARQGTVQGKAQASASDSATLARTGQIGPKVALSGFGTRANVYVKAGTISVKAQTSATDAYEATETGQVSARVRASGESVTEIVRTGTLSAVVTLGAQKEQTYTRAGTLEVKARSSAEDIAEFDRAGTVSAVVVLSGPGFSADVTVPEYPELILFTYHHAATSLWVDESEQQLMLWHETEEETIE